MLLDDSLADVPAGKEEEDGEVALDSERQANMVFIEEPATSKASNRDRNYDNLVCLRGYFLHPIENKAHAIQREHEPQRARPDGRFSGNEDFCEVPVDVVPDGRDMRVNVHDRHARRLREQVEVVQDWVEQEEQERKQDVGDEQDVRLVDKVILKIVETARAEKHSRNEEERRHAERTQMEHSHLRLRERLFHMVQAYEQQDESLELVNPPNSCCFTVAHSYTRNCHLPFKRKWRSPTKSGMTN